MDQVVVDIVDGKFVMTAAGKSCTLEITQLQAAMKEKA
jgi:hypothetical protein